MPFTLSHPSAALPFWPLVRRGYIPLAPFAIGAMAPDFEYLIRFEPYALLSHSLRGVFVFCLPLGLATYVLWKLLLQRVSRWLVALPREDSRVPLTLAGWTLVIVAVLLGSATHVAWDALTHRDAWGPVIFPWLKRDALTVAGIRVPWYNVLQLASSVAGAAVVFAWWRVELARAGRTLAEVIAPPRRRAWIALACVSIAIAAWNAPRHGLMTHINSTKLILGRIAVGAMVGFVFGLVALAILHRAGRFWLTERRPEGSAAPAGGFDD